MTKSVRFAASSTIHPYEIQPEEHQTPKDSKSEDLIISAAALVEKTMHLWDIHQRMLSEPTSILKQIPNQPLYSQLHEELDDTINGLHLLKKSTYPEPERFEHLYSTLLSRHESIHEIEDRLYLATHAKELTKQGLELTQKHVTMQREYTKEIKPRETCLTKDFIESYIQEATRQHEQSKRVQQRLEQLMPLHLENEKALKKTLDGLESFQLFLTTAIRDMEFLKDIKYMQTSKQILSPLPMGTLHEVESKEPGVKRFRFAGLY